MSGPVHIREALAPVLARMGIEEGTRRPSYWAEGPFVVSSSRRRMPIFIARDVLTRNIEAVVAESDDDLATRCALGVADLILAIRKAEAFTPPSPPPPANAAAVPMAEAA
jgi:hypothetical protein